MNSSQKITALVCILTWTFANHVVAEPNNLVVVGDAIHNSDSEVAQAVPGASAFLGDAPILKDGFESDSLPGPTISGVDYTVIAHGGRLAITGSNLSGATGVTIGGVLHTDLTPGGGSNLAVNSVMDSVAVGSQDIVVTTPSGSSAPFSVTVIHLVLSEVEVDSPLSDDHEFIELSTGVSSPHSLDGYVVVLFNGGTANGDRYRIFDLGAGTNTTADGLFLIGSNLLLNTPQLEENQTSLIQAGEDAVAVYQFIADVSGFPADYVTAGNDGLIDALIYETGSDADQAVLAPLLVSGGVADEGGTTAARDTVSIQRCDMTANRRDGDTYIVEVPTPGLVNLDCGGPQTLANCNIDFGGACPNTGSGVCGALFVDKAGNGQCHVIGVPACYASGTSFHSFDPDERVDIYLTGEVDSLATFLAPYQGTNATMQFFTLDGTEVGTPLTISTDCATGTPPLSNTPDLGSGNVRRIQVTGSADVWIDNFEVNP